MSFEDSVLDRSDPEETCFIHNLESCLLFENDDYVRGVETKEAVTALLEEYRGISEGHKSKLKLLCDQFLDGQYADILRGEVAMSLLRTDIEEDQRTLHSICKRMSSYCEGRAAEACLELEIVGVAAFNLFLQLNYTGPSIELPKISDINPHPCLYKHFFSDEENRQSSVGDFVNPDDITAATNVQAEGISSSKFHNLILSTLAVDGEFPCQVCDGPYFLYLARVILLHLATPDRNDWSYLSFAYSSTVMTESNASAAAGRTSRQEASMPPTKFSMHAKKLRFVPLWSARTAVAHQRLLNPFDPSETLWKEVNDMFQNINVIPLSKSDREIYDENKAIARVMLERGLADHHFNRKGRGSEYFQKAQDFSGLVVDLTGSIGKRTKYQQKATAQLLVRTAAQTRGETQFQTNDEINLVESMPKVAKQQIPTEIPHGEDEILLDKVQYEDENDNAPGRLAPLDQAILLSLCLNVKNDNPLDGLTAEEMGAYLERVLMQHDDWMIYSTALLERAWLECERVHGRERAILQIQALVDQHSQRLTLTQSTFNSIEGDENFAPVQKRLANLHILVYPPLWEIKADLATRYAKIGVVTTAAEIFESLGMFPEAVECYQRASKLSKAEMIIKAALKTSETPRMWLALGDITKDPTCYKKAIDVSNGRFSSAFVALGKHCFENGDLRSAGEYIEKALQIKPLNPGLWFYYGTLNMKLEQWDVSLKAFSEVVQQEPEEGEAWANIAAIHMRMLQPDKAYPALAEALKQNRNNWRMWWSKLFVCLDMRKYDEAIQSCNQLLDLRTKMNMEASIPLPEERCIRGLVGGSLKVLDEAKASYDAAAVESATRTIDRLSNLLYRLSSVTSEPWIWHVSAYFNDKLGRATLILSDRLKEYRSLQTSSGWETDAVKLKSIIDVALQINAIYQQEGSKESYARAHLMLNRLIKRIKTHYVDSDTTPEEVALLEAEIKDFSTMDEKNNL